MTKLSHEAIAMLLSPAAEKKVYYVDSFMVYRPTLPPIFTYEETCPQMLDKYSSKPALIELTGSMPNNIAYYKSRDVQVAMTDTVIVYYFSPLLKTKQKNVYLIQRYGILYDDYHPEGSHLAYLAFYEFKIVGNKIHSFKHVDQEFSMSAWGP